MDAAQEWDLTVVNLHTVTTELAPDHVPGERMTVALVKEGRQPRQAVGYLPDGDMVVVNDATHLIDEGPVLITVLSTRPTSQGVMVFAKLAPPTEVDEASPAVCELTGPGPAPRSPRRRSTITGSTAPELIWLPK